MKEDYKTLIPFCVRYLNDLTTYTNNLDNKGFNMYDAAFGRKLAGKSDEKWTARELYASWKMLKKYQGQLSEIGILYEIIPEPPQPQTKIKFLKSLIYITHNFFVLEFPYNAEIISKLQVQKNAFYHGKTQTWRIPINPQSIDFIKSLTNAFSITDEVANLLKKSGK